MNQKISAPISGTILFDISGKYKPGNSKAFFIEAIMNIIAGRPIPIPDITKFIFKEEHTTVSEYEGAKLELSWEKNADAVSFSGKILHLDKNILASFS
jgi:hypothetical protein